jgi:hypothetical protein
MCFSSFLIIALCSALSVCFVKKHGRRFCICFLHKFLMSIIVIIIIVVVVIIIITRLLVHVTTNNEMLGRSIFR